VINRIASAPANPDYLDDRILRRNFHDFEHSCLL
jgi:hypothetical protein